MKARFSQEIIYLQPSPIKSNKNDVTLVTQFTLSRLSRFENILKAWDGPLSITIYLTDPSDIDLLEAYLAIKVNAEIFDKLALTIVKPDYSNQLAINSLRLRYPINKLRNLALDLAESPYVVVTDVDFIPSPKMHHFLSTRGIPLIENSVTNSPTLRRTAIVISAFILNSTSDLFPSTTTELSRFLFSDPPKITLTDINAGHGPSTPSLLFEASSPQLISHLEWPPKSWWYEICYEPQWEPYYLLHRPSHPHYDERFTDQGGDKQSHSLLLNSLAYDFKVLRDVWFMHPPKLNAIEEAWPADRDLPSLVQEDSVHFSKAQLDSGRFRYFQDFIPELEKKRGNMIRWPRGCSARTIGGRSFGSANAGVVFGL